MSDKKDQKEITRFFNDVFNSENQLLIWQFDERANKRLIFNTYIAEFDPESNSVSFQTQDSNPFELLPGTIYLYNEKNKSIFRAEQISTQSNFLSIHYPEELKILESMQDDKLKSIFIAVNPSFITHRPKHYQLRIFDRDGDMKARIAKKKKA